MPEDTGDTDTTDTDTTDTDTDLDADSDGYPAATDCDDSDGVWDWAYGNVYVDGHLTSYWYDQGIDYEYETRNTYDADGNVLTTWVDTNGDGDPEQDATWTYEGGHLVGGSMDGDGDGGFETTWSYTWVGDRLMEELVTGGTYPYRRTNTFIDADDNYDISELDMADDGSVALDGALTSIIEYEYHDNGQTSALRHDVNGDGTWDGVYTYDSFGNNTYGMWDADANGTPDQVNVGSYDERGRRLGLTQDIGGDGVYEYEQVLRDAYVCGTM